MSVVRNKGWSEKSFKRVLMLLGGVLIWYTAIFTGIYLTSETKAQYNDVEVIAGSIHVDWEVESDTEDWDKSSFEFVTIKGDCTKIEAAFTNTGSGDAKGPLRYKIQWAPGGNGKDGTIVKEEVLQRGLKSGESITLTHKPDKEGKYRFTLFQHPNHPGKSDPTGDLTIGKCAKPKAIEKLEKAEEETDKSQSVEETLPNSDADKQEATSEKEKQESNQTNKQSTTIEEKPTGESEVVPPLNGEAKKEGEESVEKVSE
ncbi:amyloid fiber anchoring/assembly protein TapA [Rossellomorea marisflavi]|uniref:amyloid fiber anchoring/assembly protein TapA n=1 Tax=Rossellomorea marisflavi TaxID=189381 RepID=UPI00296EE032|nr:amyloid fiber anchoring/assembly protein TapA [Rossellomorea marisflavi]MDW4528314.1 amyloid fiber anchoring/assembly protein TapA [Rossellomorea marisflavi]